MLNYFVSFRSKSYQQGIMDWLKLSPFFITSLVLNQDTRTLIKFKKWSLRVKCSVLNHLTCSFIWCVWHWCECIWPCWWSWWLLWFQVQIIAQVEVQNPLDRLSQTPPHNSSCWHVRMESLYTLTHVIHVIVNQAVTVLPKQKVVIHVTINKYVLSDIQSSPSVKQVLNVYLHVFVNVRCCIYNYLWSAIHKEEVWQGKACLWVIYTWLIVIIS